MSKNPNLTKRYTEAEKDEILEFIYNYNAENGGEGGSAEASRVYGVSQQSPRNWANKRGVALTLGGSVPASNAKKPKRKYKPRKKKGELATTEQRELFDTQNAGEVDLEAPIDAMGTASQFREGVRQNHPPLLVNCCPNCGCNISFMNDAMQVLANERR